MTTVLAVCPPWQSNARREFPAWVGRISIVCMNSAWYGREQITRTLIRFFGSQPANPSKQYGRSQLLR